MGKPRQKRKRTKRAIRQRLDAIEHILAAREASELPTPAEQRAAADCIREGLREKLRIASRRGPHEGGSEDEVILTGTALELQFRFRKMAEAHEAERVRRSEELLRRCATAWTKSLRGEPEKVQPDEKVIPISRKQPDGGIAAGFSEANSGGFESDDYSNIRGMSESELWAWQARHPRSK